MAKLIKNKKGRGKGEQIFDQATGTISEQSISAYGDDAMYRYGIATIEDRALPDLHDGLKPVQRRIAWAMHKMGLRSNVSPLKSARVVGDTIGKYHPHGDAAAYGAMVNMVHLPVEIVDGSSSNFGSMTDNAAAYRYTNARLSKYADVAFFQKAFVDVVDYVANYDGKDTEPVVLPATLPNLLINGSFGIAVGGTSHIPAFHPSGLITLVKKALKGEAIEVKDCLKNLTFNYKYGGAPYLEEKEYVTALKELYKTGVGKVVFTSPYEWDAAKRTMTFRSFAPNLDLLKTIGKISEFWCIGNIEDATSIEDGYCYIITLGKNVPKADLEEIRDDLASYFETTMHYKINFTERVFQADAEKEKDKIKVVPHTEVGIPKLLEMWTAWRIELELKALKNSLVDQQAAIGHTNLLLLALANKDIIRKSWEMDDGEDFLCKKLKIKPEQARIIYDLKIRQLSKLDGDKLKKQLKDQQAQEAQLKAWIKKPAEKVAADLTELEKMF